MVAKETELNGHEHPDTAGASCQLARVLLEHGELDAAAPLLLHAMRLLNLPVPAAAEVRFCRYRFSPTGDLGYSVCQIELKVLYDGSWT